MRNKNDIASNMMKWSPGRGRGRYRQQKRGRGKEAEWKKKKTRGIKITKRESES